MTRRLLLCLALTAAATVALLASPLETFYPIDQVRPGQVGIGRTVFADDVIEEFKVNILGTIRNVMGPKRDLILARLEGGPLATTGVIAGMSGSPVYIDGKLVGAVSYALGSFPREPIAGITPIGEMVDAVDAPAPAAGAPARRATPLAWPATPAQVFSYLNTIAERAAAPLQPATDLSVLGPPALAAFAPSLRPIGSAMVFNGFDPSLDASLRGALAPAGSSAPGAQPDAAAADDALRPGDSVGVSMVRGDLEMGATGTVTYVDGSKVYGFGHPFLNLGSTTLSFTRAHVLGVLPSLDASLKIASLGPVIGTMTQDRATAIGGKLGAGPSEMQVNVTLDSDRATPRHFEFEVMRDQQLTPLFAYVAILNTLVSYERQSGALTIGTSGTLSFGKDGSVSFDDLFSGDTALAAASTSFSAPMTLAATNDFKVITPEKLDVTLHVTEGQQGSTIERVWLDTTTPHYGQAVNVQVLTRDYRGATETTSIPVQMPEHAHGPLTLLVSDAPTLTSLEQRDLKPGRATNWRELLEQMNAMRRNNRIYVRLISTEAGAVVGGETMPALPASVRSILGADASVSSSAVSRSVMGAWELRTPQTVKGSRELTITLTADK